MQELNKTQVVLLTLFITFVTSVTTGIVTVTLLEQAPPAVTQTINRVVERTIEKVTPIRTEVKQTTVLLSGEEAIIKTASMIKPAVVRIVLPGEAIAAAKVDTNVENQAAVISAAADSLSNEAGTGFIISSDGLVVTSYGIIPDQNINYGVYVGDKRYNASVIFYSKSEGIAILKIDHDSGTKFLTPQFIIKPVTLGQTVIVLGRDLTRYTVSVGLISSLKEGGPSALPSFKTTVKSDETNIGGPLLSSDGLLVGLNLSGGNAIPVELIKTHLNVGTSTVTKTQI